MFSWTIELYENFTHLSKISSNEPRGEVVQRKVQLNRLDYLDPGVHRDIWKYGVPSTLMRPKQLFKSFPTQSKLSLLCLV